MLLTVPMAAAGLLLTVLSLRWHAPVAPLSLPWWVFVPAALASNAFVLHLEIREEAHSFTLSELPVVVGMFFAPPWAVILGRVTGELAVGCLWKRQSPDKLAFNTSMFLLETSAAVAVFRSLSMGRPPMDRACWPAVVLAVAVADLISMVAVTTVIRWHGERISAATVLAASAATAVVNVSLALLAAILLWLAPFSMVLLAVVGVMTGLANRGYVHLKQRYASLQVLYDFTRAVGSSMDEETVIRQVLEESRRLLKSDLAEIVLLGADNHRPVTRQRLIDDCLMVDDSTTLDEGSAWRTVIDSGQALVVARPSRSRKDVSARGELGVRDFIIAPLFSEDAVVGAIMVGNRMGEASTYDEQDGRLFEMLANHASVAFHNGRLLEQLRQEAAERHFEARHDPLTGLPNRSLFVEIVNEACARDIRSAVMLMDLDRFKEVNDTLGHHHGDLLLQSVASRLRTVIDHCGTVARLGGDEFAIVLPGLDGDDDGSTKAQEVLNALRAPFLIDQLSLDVSASIGIAIAPLDGSQAATLLQRADVAMYESKAIRGTVSMYSTERDDYSPDRLALAGELRGALDDGAILVYHQPKARLSDGTIVGTEALVRWHHPQRGIITPDEFIPIAEHTGLIAEITAHVLRAAISQCAAWRSAGHDVHVSVNLSMRSLLDADLPDSVGALLDRAGLPAGCLTLEITESSIMADPTRAIAVLERLAAAGITISVDDFGTGYSSLAYLQRLPVGEVKIDKSFVLNMATDPNDLAIVQSIVELGHNLGLSVVAEGVEDQLSWDRLRALSCDIAQGYLLSKPVPASAITSWLDSRGSARYELRAAKHLSAAPIAG